MTAVSTRRVDKLLQMLGIDGIDKNQVLRIFKELDQRVAEFRNRPLDGSLYRYVLIDALYIKSREGGRTVGVTVQVATAVNEDRQREMIGLDMCTSETGAAWTAFLRGLVARGLSGGQLLVSATAMNAVNRPWSPTCPKHFGSAGARILCEICCRTYSRKTAT